MKRLGPWLAAALLAAGCYDSARVRPAELPKLNDSYSQNLYGAAFASNGKTALTTVTDRTVRHLITDEGKVVEVQGEASVVLETARGIMDFRHPIIANLRDDQVLEIAAGNRAQTDIALADVHTATVSWYDQGKTLLAVCGISLMVTVPVMMIAYSKLHH
jgi:hypothetical protein